MLTRGQQEPERIPQWECVVGMQLGNEDASKGMPAVFVVSDRMVQVVDVTEVAGFRAYGGVAVVKSVVQNGWMSGVKCGSEEEDARCEEQ